MHNPSTGELLFRRTKGGLRTDGESYHRELRWDIPHDYIDRDCRLLIEFSVPKYWYGNNIHLLYDFAQALRHLKSSLETQFELKGKARLPDVMTWQVLRADLCYAWRFTSQELAQRYLDSLKRLHYPRKRPTYYPTAILFAGHTYSFKVYLKFPEFKSHDRKELLKAKASLEWINHLEALAYGVLRAEATLRQKYLKRNGIETVSDLVEPVVLIEWHEDQTKHPYHPKLSVDSFLAHQEELGVRLEDGTVLTMPPVQVGYFDENGKIAAYPHPGGDFTLRKLDRTVVILKRLLVKFIGENAGMQQADQVETKLMGAYKPIKAARLMSFWLYIQRFGSEKAKEMFGSRNYYYCKSDLKKAGVSLAEPPKVTDEMQDFKLEIPSRFVTNRVDDFRDHSNILNFVPKISGLDP